MKHTASNNVYGIVCMLINTLSLALLYTVMKYLTKTLSSSQVVFFYKLGVLLVVIPLVFKDGLAAFRPNNLKLLFLRGILSIAGTLAYMYGLTHVQLIDAAALQLLEQIMLTILGVIYFKEKFTSSKGFAALLSFIGAVIIIYPTILQFQEGSYIPILFKERSFDDFNHYYLFILLAVGFWTVNCFTIKLIGKTERTHTQLFYVTLFSCILSYPLVFFNWNFLDTGIQLAAWQLKIPSIESYIPVANMGFEIHHIKYILLVTLLYFIHSITNIQALKYAEMSTVAPFYYAKLVFAGIFGYVIFQAEPNQYAYTGYILIVAAGLLLIKAEAKSRKKARALQAMIEEE